MNKFKMTYIGKPIETKSDVEDFRNKLDKQRVKSKTIREVELLGYAYFLLRQVEIIIEREKK